MSNKVQTVTVDKTRRLIDLNSNYANFELEFSCTSKNREEFEAVIVDQARLDTSPDLPYQQSHGGRISGKVVFDKNVFQNWWLVLRSQNEHPIEVVVELNIRELPTTQPPAPPPESGGSNWKLILIILLVVGGLAFLYYWFTQKSDGNENEDEDVPRLMNEPRLNEPRLSESRVNEPRPEPRLNEPRLSEPRPEPRVSERPTPRLPRVSRLSERFRERREARASASQPASQPASQSASQPASQPAPPAPHSQAQPSQAQPSQAQPSQSAPQSSSQAQPASQPSQAEGRPRSKGSDLLARLRNLPPK